VRKDGSVLIGEISRRYSIHPQTLRMYEREGLIQPDRTEGNTRLYGEETVERLEIILTLTRDLGVNLAGVEVILNMREQLAQMKAEVDVLLRRMQQETSDRRAGIDRRHALVKIERGPLVKR